MALSVLPDPAHLKRLALAIMPYGKHAGRRLVDLPEPYVVWLVNNQLPQGTLGKQLLEIYEIKVNGLESLLKRVLQEGGQLMKYPWKQGTRPLMLAPMQGLTNSAMRQCFIDHYEPDVVFTEFVRVNSQSRKRVKRADMTDITSASRQVPLVVQLIGNQARALADAAESVEAAGCQFINLNLGCPYGRMTSGATGGELLKNPLALATLLKDLRAVVRGSFSVKCRAGYDDPQQIFSLLPVFADCGVDFLILHPRTVVQKYAGHADHEVTAEVAISTRLPVIANGDINDPSTAWNLLEKTAVAGLMLGRGALADPLLFRRIRGQEAESVSAQQQRRGVYDFVSALVPGYLEKFCGERQTLMKLKDVLNFISYPSCQRDLGKLKRCVTISRFTALLEDRFAHFPAACDGGE